MRHPWFILLLLAFGCKTPCPPPASQPASRPAHAEDKPLEPVAVRPFALGKPDLVLLITGATHGRMEVCNCSGPMPGGLSRRSGLFASYRKAHRAVAAIDTGEAFWLNPQDLRNRYMLPAYQLLDYHAVVLGDNAWRARQQDKHSRAWKTLVDNDRTYDPSCVMCHTSGFGTADGFRSPRETPALANVNCMDCHRLDFQAGRHRGRPDKTVKEDTCTICHTLVNSPAFEYDKYRPHVGCVWSRTGPKPTTGPAKTPSTRFVDRPVPGRE